MVTDLTGFTQISATIADSAMVGGITGNAATATTLATARTIGGVSFNGSANINLPGVNAAGNQNTTGSAATLTTGRTFQTNLASTTAVSFNGSANISPGVTGTLPVGNGGTGATTLTGLVKGNGTGAFTAAVAGTDFAAPNQTMFIGTTSVAINRASAALTLAGVSLSTLTIGTGLSGTSYNGSAAVTVAIDSTVATLTGTQTLTNKRVTSRIGTVASTATPSIDINSFDQYNITALAANITSVTVTGTPTDGQKLLVRIKGTAARTIAWGASFVSSGVAVLPTTTVTTKTHLVGFMYDSAAAKWVCVASDWAGY